MTHQNKHVREAIEYALARGWRFTKAAGGSAHLTGTLWCPAGDRSGHHFHVRSTPRNSEAHAKDIRRSVRRCPHSTP